MIEVTYEHHGGTDLATVNSARVSFNKRSDELSKKDAKLVSYLSEHKHTSPFNHAYATFTVKAPIFVARQLS
jgi:thymidylate synthase (FAD)